MNIRNILLLIAISAIILYLVTSVEMFTGEQDVLVEELAEQLRILDERFSNIDIFEGRKSYTINKQKVYICVKDKNGRYYPRNHLVYVMCHELAHVICPEFNHTPKFRQIFQELLTKAEHHGLYDSRIPPLKNYCGHK